MKDDFTLSSHTHLGKTVNLLVISDVKGGFLMAAQFPK